MWCIHRAPFASSLPKIAVGKLLIGEGGNSLAMWSCFEHYFAELPVDGGF